MAERWPRPASGSRGHWSIFTPSGGAQRVSLVLATVRIHRIPCQMPSSISIPGRTRISTHALSGPPVVGSRCWTRCERIQLRDEFGFLTRLSL
jgi:hypothetical protein